MDDVSCSKKYPIYTDQRNSSHDKEIVYESSFLKESLNSTSIEGKRGKLTTANIANYGKNSKED